MQLQNKVVPSPQTDKSPNHSVDKEKDVSSETAYEKLMHSLHYDAKWLEEVNLGRRVGLYRFRGELGSGNFSQVKMAVHQLTKERVAVKMLDKGKLDDKMRKMLSQEVSTMESVHHPNLIRLYEVVETYSKLYLVMEYASGGELFNKVTTCGKLEEMVARQLFAQLSSAVSHMHDRHIIHRDIKAENVFFSAPNRVKLGDFGFSAQLSTAPELFCDENYVGGPVDVWAMGVLLFFMVVGRMPFRGHNVPSLKASIMSAEYVVPRHVSKECTQLIDGVLKHKPSERMSVDQMLDCDWLKGVPLPPPPDPSQEYSMTPTVPAHRPPAEEPAPDMYSEMETVARERLAALGISGQLLAAHHLQGSRSHVIGCYRIVVHRVQKQMGAFVEVDGFLPSADPWSRKPSPPPKKPQTRSRKSDLMNCWGRAESAEWEEPRERRSLTGVDCREGKGRLDGRQTKSASGKPRVEVRSITCNIL